MQQKHYKYRINELLLKLSVEDNKKALKILPGELEVSEATFNNYRKILLEDTQDIPHNVVDKLEKFFSINPGELQNYTSDIRPIAEITEPVETLAAKHGLSKPIKS